MSAAKNVSSPSIAFLDPDRVEQGWEGAVELHGSGFDNGSFALFDGAALRTNYRSDTLLEAEVKGNITGTSGTKEVKVHKSDGSVSNGVDFAVSPRSAGPSGATGA
jgi:hypothetical protein